jgi:hypothetical protein
MEVKHGRVRQKDAKIVLLLWKLFEKSFCEFKDSKMENYCSACSDRLHLVMQMLRMKDDGKIPMQNQRSP